MYISNVSNLFSYSDGDSTKTLNLLNCQFQNSFMLAASELLLSFVLIFVVLNFRCETFE